MLRSPNPKWETTNPKTQRKWEKGNEREGTTKKEGNRQKLSLISKLTRPYRFDRHRPIRYRNPLRSSLELLHRHLQIITASHRRSRRHQSPPKTRQNLIFTTKSVFATTTFLRRALRGNLSASAPTNEGVATSLQDNTSRRDEQVTR